MASGEEPPATTSATRLLAAAALVTGIFVFSLQDLILKWVSGTYPLTQAVAIRSTTAIVILLAWIAYKEGLHRIFSRRWRPLALRGSILMIAYSTYYLALPAMKLAEVVTLFFMAPIFITALAHPLLGERVGFTRWLAVLAGFCGVILCYWPEIFGSGQGVALDWALLLPVGAALAYGFSALMTRRLGPTVSASVMGLYQNVMFLVWVLAFAAFLAAFPFDRTALHPSLAFLLRPWSFANPWDLALLAACGPISALGTVLLSQAYRLTEANFVTTFEYTGLIWAAMWGFLIWGEVPDLYMIAGAALIVGAGLYMLFAGHKGAATSP